MRSWRQLTEHPVRATLVVAAAAILLALTMIALHGPTREALLPNLAPELIGVAIGSAVTVLILERAIVRAEERRRQPLTDQVLFRIRAHTERAIAQISRWCLDGPRGSPGAIKERVQLALANPKAFADMTESDRQQLYDALSRNRDVMIEELRTHQVIFSWHPRIYYAIVAVDYRILEWSVYRDSEDLVRHPEEYPDAAEERPAIINVAEAFLALDRERLSVAANDATPYSESQ